MSEIEWLDIFGTNLIVMLDENLMTQKDLAEATGLSEGTISKYVNKTQMPTVRAILNISYALNCSLDDLIDFGDTIEGQDIWDDGEHTNNEVILFGRVSHYYFNTSRSIFDCFE